MANTINPITGQPYDYDTATPPPPLGDSKPRDPGIEILADYNTVQLKSWRQSLRNPIPTDPGFLAAVAGALGMYLDRELAHPLRRKRDEEAAKVNAKAAHDARVAAIKARYDAERKASPADAKAGIDARQKAEIDALDAEAKQRELNDRQTKDRAEFAQKQAQERSAVVGATPVASTQTLTSEQRKAEADYQARLNNPSSSASSRSQQPSPPASAAVGTPSPQPAPFRSHGDYSGG